MPETRKARMDDLDAITEIYEEIHTLEERGSVTVGWIRGTYPTRETALQAIKNDEMFVMEENGEIIAAAVINDKQVDAYAQGEWEHEAEKDEVLVLHTLVTAPDHWGRGLGKLFVKAYEDMARCARRFELRMDTNARNARARRLYRGLGYKEIGTVPTVFNGIAGVSLVLLEKRLSP